MHEYLLAIGFLLFVTAPLAHAAFEGCSNNAAPVKERFYSFTILIVWSTLFVVTLLATANGGK